MKDFFFLKKKKETSIQVPLKFLLDISETLFTSVLSPNSKAMIY